MTNKMDALVDGAQQKLEHLETALDAMQTISARFTTDDGVVTAQVDGNGALTGLWFDESITNMQAKDVGPLITWAGHQAAVKAAEQRAKIVARLNEGFGAEQVQPE